MIKYLLIACLALAVLCAGLAAKVAAVAEQRDQLETAIRVSRDSTRLYENKLGEVVASKEAIELDRRNMKAMREELSEITRHFQGVDKRLGNVESLMKASGTATRTFETGVRDTLVIKDGNLYKAWAFTDGDKYFSIKGMVVTDSAFRRVIATPSLTIDVFGAEIRKKPRQKFLGLRIGRRTKTYELTTDNPYVKFNKVDFYKKSN